MHLQLDIARRKDRILSEVKVPLCGDLLGRERVTGAKQTRMGCDYKTERFDNIVENVAQWHAKQSFLGVRKCNIFCNFKCTYYFLLLLESKYLKLFTVNMSIGGFPNLLFIKSWKKQFS